MGLLEKHGSDAVRYWAASARLGTDAAFDEQQMKIGRRLALKVLNGSKFAFRAGGENAPVVLDPRLVTCETDRSMLAELAKVITRATQALEDYDHTRALEVTETCFWTFCDDYLELVKARATDRDGALAAAGKNGQIVSARVALNLAVDVFVRLLAPVLPYATEEVWSWYRTGSVHRAPWPKASELADAMGNTSEDVLHAASEALRALRKIKTEAKVSQRTPYSNVTVQAPKELLGLLESARGDLTAAASVTGQLRFVGAEDADSPVQVTDFTLIETPKR